VNLRRRLFRALSSGHVRLYRALGGRYVGRGAGGVPLLLLTTVGRVTGRRYTVPVGYIRENHGFLVVPSGGGSQETHWSQNLRTQPVAEVEVGRDRLGVQAQVLEGSAREEARQRVIARHPIYRRVSPALPVIRLTPLGER
jgi:deazaflavin-dependent oxidoreductase (nitroreductase family)